jgi:endonuclease G, mitochondrial
MYYKILLILVLSITGVWANPIDDKCPQHVLLGAPVSKIKQNNQYLCKINYAIHYRYDTKTAEYVVEHVTIEGTTGSSKRKDDFRPDPAIPAQHNASLKDYAGNPYDRGHLAPAGNNTQNDQVMSESFFLSNMVPQVPNHNRGIWKQLETFVRDWVVDHGMDLYVISGTAYNKEFKTIGEGRVGVPDQLWKVIIDRKEGKAIAFVFPNTALPVEDLPKYVTTVAEVEKLTGINFMPKLPKEKSKIEKTTPDLNKWPKLLN